MLRTAIPFNSYSKVGSFSSKMLAESVTKNICPSLVQKFNFLALLSGKHPFLASVTTPPPLPNTYRAVITPFIAAIAAYAFQDKLNVRCRMLDAIGKACKEGTKEYIKEKTKLSEDDKRFLIEIEQKAIGFLVSKFRKN